MSENTMTVKEAALRCGVHESTIRAGLISKTLPFGIAMMCKRKYTYIIMRKRFEAWESGADLREEKETSEAEIDYAFVDI